MINSGSIERSEIRSERLPGLVGRAFGGQGAASPICPCHSRIIESFGFTPDSRRARSLPSRALRQKPKCQQYRLATPVTKESTDPVRCYRLSRGLSGRCSAGVAADSSSSRTESGKSWSASASHSRRLFARNNCVLGLCVNSIDHHPSALAWRDPGVKYEATSDFET